MDFGKFWGEGLSVMESLSWEPEKGSEIVLIPRGRKGPAVSIPAGHGYCLHFINCFEQDDRVVVDILELDEPVYKEYQPIPDLFPAAPGCRPVRFVVDPARGTLLERIAMSYDRTPDFSSVPAAQAGHPYTDFWMLGISEAGREGRKFFDQLAHGSWKHGGVADVYQFPKGEYVGGEPVHIANPANPEEGVVIVEHLIPGEGKAEALVFDSASVASGPIVRLPLRHQIHPGFHSSFAFAND
jgi:all-trans-8'-apo-beta-carotenal 15,15'-oxygenase